MHTPAHTPTHDPQACTDRGVCHGAQLWICSKGVLCSQRQHVATKCKFSNETPLVRVHKDTQQLIYDSHASKIIIYMPFHQTKQFRKWHLSSSWCMHTFISSMELLERQLEKQESSRYKYINSEAGLIYAGCLVVTRWASLWLEKIWFCPTWAISALSMAHAHHRSNKELDQMKEIQIVRQSKVVAMENHPYVLFLHGYPSIRSRFLSVQSYKF